jgi:endonuclease VIII
VEQGRPVTTGDRRAPLWVYRRQRQPCRRCGTTIVAGAVGDPARERTTYWCPRCQPDDRVDLRHNAGSGEPCDAAPR